MLTCDWCKKETTNLYEVNNDSICRTCTAEYFGFNDEELHNFEENDYDDGRNEEATM